VESRDDRAFPYTLMPFGILSLSCSTIYLTRKQDDVAVPLIRPFAMFREITTCRVLFFLAYNNIGSTAKEAVDGSLHGSPLLRWDVVHNANVSTETSKRTVSCSRIGLGNRL